MPTPETDASFRNRLLSIVRDDDRPDVTIASGYGLDGFGSLYGLARKGLPESSLPNSVAAAFRAIETGRSAPPAILPMPPGSRPTEPGWYVAEDSGCRMMVEVSHSSPDLAFFAGVSGPATLDSLTFIARIFPERVGQE